MPITISGSTVIAPSQTIILGARAKLGSGVTLRQAFDQAELDLGTLSVTRAFETALPNVHQPVSPAHCVEIVSFKSATQAAFDGFISTMRPGTKLIFHHEPEGPTDFANGADFVAQFRTLYDMAHSSPGAPARFFGMIAGGFQYISPGGNGVDGSYIPPPDKCDWYAFDSYSHGTSSTGNQSIKPIQQYQAFQTWWALTKNKGRDLYITEYGRGTYGQTEIASTPDDRAAIIPLDVRWLDGQGFKYLSYFYSDFGPDGGFWQFEDPQSIAAWKSVSGG